MIQWGRQLSFEDFAVDLGRVPSQYVCINAEPKIILKTFREIHVNCPYRNVVYGFMHIILFFF